MRFLVLPAMLLVAGAANAGEFSGGGGSLWFGTGSPGSIGAAERLSNDLDVNEETGNYSVGVLGFYQGDRYRIGAAFQAQAWAGINPGRSGAEDDAAGVAAAIGGLYATYTFRHDRVLFNAGGIVGAGRALLGYRRGDLDVDEHEDVATFYVEPQASAGFAVCRWFAVEFHAGAPLYLLVDDLTLVRAGETYTVTSDELVGITFGARLTFGKLAAW